MASLKYWLWLASLPGVGGVMKNRLLEHFGGPEEVYCSDSGEYFLVEGMTRAAAARLEEKSLEEADRILGDCDRLGLRILTLRDTEYPDRLRNIYDPPLVLYVQGRLPLMDDEVAIAMVGTRKASPYAQEMGEKLAFQLAGLGAVVVSGLAAGGDAAAHRGALRAGGLTVAVIGGGHDIIYPARNRGLYEDIAVRGAILSEYPPGTQHEGAHFPVRNRIISGLSLGVVVMEAPERSGALITASRALDQGPGRVRHARPDGRLALRRQQQAPPGRGRCGHRRLGHPQPLCRPLPPQDPGHPQGGAGEVRPARGDELRQPLRQRGGGEGAPTCRCWTSSGDHGLTDDQIRIVRALQGRTVQVDDLIEETQIPTRRVLSALTMLELDRIVTRARASGSPWP